MGECTVNEECSYSYVREWIDLTPTCDRLHPGLRPVVHEDNVGRCGVVIGAITHLRLNREAM
jgi:hypothetical protein